MEINRIEGATRVLGAPPDWNQDQSGPCLGLPVKDVQTPDGLAWMVSSWSPSPQELAALNRGETIKLWINGTTHPVVALSVGDV